MGPWTPGPARRHTGPEVCDSQPCPGKADRDRPPPSAHHDAQLSDGRAQARAVLSQQPALDPYALRCLALVHGALTLNADSTWAAGLIYAITNLSASLCALAAKPGIPLIACESIEEMDSVTYMGNRGFAGVNVGVDRAVKLGRDGLLLRSGLQTDRGES